MKNQVVKYQNLGRISYKEAWDIQTDLHESLKKDKMGSSDKSYIPEYHHLLICEHNPVFTIGKSGKIDHLLINEDLLASKGIEFYHTNRGGDITYHGPGQITGYPILDLDYFVRDVHLYVRNLEQVIINALSRFGIKADRIEGKTGVWILGKINRKICAIGVHMSRWVTLHGFALNVKTELNHFDYIVPCGIKDENMTVCSMESILCEEVDIDEVKLAVKNSFKEVFNIEYKK